MRGGTIMMELQMFTQDEVAEMLHAHVTTITTLREIGILPAIKTGRSFMFTKESIINFQHNYQGMDVSNRVKAIEAYQKVSERMGVKNYAHS